jgi:transposase
MTHDYKRNGTTTLFAALNVADGTVIAHCEKRHRHQEWLRFLKTVDQQTPPDLDLHLIVDNYATHKHARVRGWLEKHPRFHIHFIPTSSSWLNLVESFFSKITTKTIRRGTFSSVADLTDAIVAYIDDHNADPKPFVWTASAASILDKVGRARAALDKVPPAAAEVRAGDERATGATARSFYPPDLADVQDWEAAKPALEIAAAGGHLVVRSKNLLT